MLLAAATFHEAMMAIGSLGVILLVFGVIVVWALRQSMASTKAQKDTYDKACTMNEEIIRLAEAQLSQQLEGHRLIAELIDALRSFKHHLGESADRAN